MGVRRVGFQCSYDKVNNHRRIRWILVLIMHRTKRGFARLQRVIFCCTKDRNMPGGITMKLLQAQLLLQRLKTKFTKNCDYNCNDDIFISFTCIFQEFIIHFKQRFKVTLKVHSPKKLAGLVN